MATRGTTREKFKPLIRTKTSRQNGSGSAKPKFYRNSSLASPPLAPSGTGMSNIKAGSPFHSTTPISTLWPPTTNSCPASRKCSADPAATWKPSTAPSSSSARNQKPSVACGFDPWGSGARLNGLRRHSPSGHKLQLLAMPKQAPLVRAAQKPPDRFPAALAVIQCPVVHVHPHKLVRQLQAHVPRVA